MDEAKENHLAELKQELKTCVKERDELNVKIKGLEKYINAITIDKFDWQEKCIECLKIYDVPLTTVEIIEKLMEHNVLDIYDPTKKNIYVKQLSLVLNRLCNKNILCGIQVSGYKGKFYLIYEWLEDDIVRSTKMSYIQLKLNRKRNDLIRSFSDEIY